VVAVLAGRQATTGSQGAVGLVSVALSVLGARVNADRGGRFAVLLRGEGPDLGIRSID